MSVTGAHRPIAIPGTPPKSRLLRALADRENLCMNEIVHARPALPPGVQDALREEAQECSKLRVTIARIDSAWITRALGLD